MKLTAKEQYGLRALAELAQRYGSGPVALSEIAQAQGLSLGYLEQIAAALRQAGLVVSRRGASGGYSLARPPEKITVGDVVRVLEGGIRLLPCLEDERVRGAACARAADCARQAVWGRLQSRLELALGQVTLADLIAETYFKCVERKDDDGGKQYP